MMRSLYRLMDVLFLPVFWSAGVGILALILLMILKKKSCRDLCVALIGLIVLIEMIGWRLLVAGGSSRYWTAVLFPGIFLIVFSCYAVGWGKRIARILFAALVIACLLKDFRLNWNDRAITDAAAVIAADAKQYRRVFATEFSTTGLTERIGYYAHVPTLIYRYCDGMRIQHVFWAAENLYDACYIIYNDKPRENKAAYEYLKSYGAKLLFSHDKDMRRKKKIYVYKVDIPKQKKALPILEELCPNGNFEEIVTDKSGNISPRHWGKHESVKLIQNNVATRGNRMFFKSNKVSLLYSARVPVPKKDGVMLFSVSATEGSHINIYAFARIGNKLVQKIMMNIKVPEDIVDHQFQIPIRVAEFALFETVSYYWFVVSPRGMYLDDIGFYPLQASNSKL